MRLILFFTIISIFQLACSSKKNAENKISEIKEKEVIPTVKNPKTGRIWMDRNLGAEQVATSPNDFLAYGDLYQWGREKDGHEIRTSDATLDSSLTDIPGHSKFILGNKNGDWRYEPNEMLWSNNNVNNVCPFGFHVPTKIEWETEIATWAIQNANGAFNSILKLPLAGVRGISSINFENGEETFSSEIDGEKERGEYWSNAASDQTSFYLEISQDYNQIHDSHTRWIGRSIRCIKNQY